MAAYAALVSPENIIDNLRLHCRPPIVLHKEQAHLLTQKLTFLQQFLQLYNPNLDYNQEADPLESRIARAAYAAEDAIESNIFDHLNNNGEKMSSDGLYAALEKVIEDMATIEKEAMEIKETVEFNNHLHTKSRTPVGSTSSLISQKKSSMVGADDLLLEMKDKLTSNQPDLQTFPIVGMSGSGKTTLTLNIFHDAFIEEYFDIRVWVTISQEYSIGGILKKMLTQLNRESSEDGSGEVLHKHLYGRKYIIILDDMWNLEAWDGVRRYFPNNKNGSRIVITTRLKSLASALSNSNIIGMKLLDENDSWDLLSKTVFGEKGCCPPELEDVGKKIGKSCKGLPLSIVVVGGLLAKSEQTIEYWVHVKENLNAIVNLDDGERCLKTLYMSYKQLPVHLKPCFLYMGIYREDYVIRITKLVKLWVAEGFLKPRSGKTLEDVSSTSLKCLINYPQSLKKLFVDVSLSQCWRGILDKIGELPLLQKLTLHSGTFKGQWETSEGQLRSLKYLSLIDCSGIQVWTSEASHFHRLEQLRLYRLSDPEEIPSDFAEISTLGLIKLYKCIVILLWNRLGEC